MRAPFFAAALVGATCLFTGPIAAQAPTPFGLDVLHLELSLDLDHDEGSLQGWASYRIANRSDLPVSEIPFNLGRLLMVRGAETPGGETLAFSQGVDGE